MKYLLVLWLIVLSFSVGRFFGRMDGPRVQTVYMEPPEAWRSPNLCHDVWLSLRDKGWHEGIGWKFSNLTIDRVKKTVTGYCAKDRQ